AIACPYPIFADLRSGGGVAWVESLGAWMITRYDDVRAILRDTERFSSLFPTGPAAGGEALMKGIMQLMQEPEMQAVLGSTSMQRGRAAVLLNADPPEHRRQRRLVNPAFRPDRIRGMEPAIRATTERLLEDVCRDLRETGTVEIVSRFAVGLPMTIIALALGVPDDDLATFKRWSDDLVMPVGNHNPSTEQVRGFVLSTKAFNEYFLARVAERRVTPTDDILSDIANAEIDGEELSDDEQLGMLTQFLVAGNETTTKLITNTIRYLAEDPELQARVRADRSLVETLVEEMLRIEAPVGGLFRQAKVDVEINGTTIPAGDHMWLLFASANRDECKFAQPDRVDLDRTNVKEHLAFGNGEHFCPGAGLARTEARIAVDLLLDRLDDISLAPGNDFEFEDSFVLRGLKRLVVSARPRS
ncbi:MAG: cytochrome P450, partial [Actinobacteria bacterium]|nr:cytochrome P450 [Actinomycetota bacterium]